MKKAVFIGSIFVILLGIFIIMPFYKSSSLCTSIKTGQTEDAIVKIDKMQNVNGVECPPWIRNFLNRLDYEVEIPLIEACKKGNYQVVDALLNEGADPNWFYEGGFTAAEAVFVGNSLNELEMLKLLKKYDADLTMAECGTSPLFLAARKMIYSENIEQKVNYADCVTYLLQYDTNLIDEKGYSILYYATLADDLQLMGEIISSHRELINHVSANGQTPIFEAVKNNSVEAVRLLKEKGAALDVINANGESLHEYAVQYGNEEIEEILIEN